MNKLITLIVFLAIILLIIYLNKPSGLNQELERREAIHKYRLDSIERVLKDSIHKRELFYLKHFSEAMKKLDRLEGERNHYRNKYNEEVNRRRSFTDGQLDSLLANVQ